MRKFRVYDNVDKKYPENQMKFILNGGKLFEIVATITYNCWFWHRIEECDPDRYTVEESTGKFDKNSKEIYCGDMDKDYVVLFNDKLALYCLHYKSILGKYEPASYPMFANEITITGNIHGGNDDK